MNERLIREIASAAIAGGRSALTELEGMDVLDADLAPNRAGGRLVIPGEHNCYFAHFLQTGDDCIGLKARLVGHRDIPRLVQHSVECAQ